MSKMLPKTILSEKEIEEEWPKSNKSNFGHRSNSKLMRVNHSISYPKIIIIRQKKKNIRYKTLLSEIFEMESVPFLIILDSKPFHPYIISVRLIGNHYIDYSFNTGFIIF